MERKWWILLYEVISIFSHLRVHFSKWTKWNFLASWNVSNLTHANLSLIFLVALYANSGWLQECFVEEWIYDPLRFRRFKREIPYKVLKLSHGCDLPTNMATTLEQTYKLPNLISTIPTTTASDKQSFSALMRIKTYLHLTESQARLVNSHFCKQRKVSVA